MMEMMTTGAHNIDALVEDLFNQEFFAIGFGILLWFAIQWSIDRNKKESYTTLGKWLHDQIDEIFVVTLVGFALISFDDVAVRQIERSWDKIVEPGKVVYLLSGPITLALMKIINKLRS